MIIFVTFMPTLNGVVSLEMKISNCFLVPDEMFF